MSTCREGGVRRIRTRPSKDSKTLDACLTSAPTLSAFVLTDRDTAKDVKRNCFDIVERIALKPGEMRIALSGVQLARFLDVDVTRINEDLLTLASPFQHRKRGVETKLIIGDEPATINATLLRNIARAHRYFDLVRSGRTLAEIAEIEGVSKRRVQQLIELAFLVPDVIRAVREGRQPVGMTSDWLIRHAFSPIWAEQRKAFAAL